MTSPILMIMVSLLGAVTEIEQTYHRALAGDGASVADVQAAWAETMGLRVVSEEGVIATGKHVQLTTLNPADLVGEITDGAVIRNYVSIGGHGPDPLQLLLPKDPDGRALAIYRRVEAGLFIELAHPPESAGAYWKIDVTYPGEFVVHEPRTGGEGKLKGLFPSFPPSVSGSERKWVWQLFRVGIDEAVGPVPLLMIHGAGTDRWSEFTHWARFSPEAADFRQRFQIWNFSHPMSGINAPIGFDPECPEFDESIVAYLYRRLEVATEEGTTTAEGTSKFPADGPITIITNSHGALKARAFMVNFPEYGDRVLGAVTLGGPHMGTPWATPEWLRFTASRFGLLTPNLGERLVEDAITSNYVSLSAQSDLDMGWPNFDAEGGAGIPYRRFNTWTQADGAVNRVLSPRDANVSDARTLPGYDDQTFDPQVQLETFCGGMEHITPALAGGLYMDRFFLYGSYLYRGRGWLDMFLRSDDGVVSGSANLFENSSLRAINAIMGFVPSAGADWPMSPYRMGDGFVPLQSQLMLDGKETIPVYKTHEVLGWRVPVLPFTPDLELIAQHTLADPERIRIWPGWSHLDTVTGRYNKETGHSELFMQVAADLSSVLPDE